MVISEGAPAQACRQYLEDVLLTAGVFEGRGRMASEAEHLYVRRLRISEGKARAAAARAALEDRETVIVEMAHDGQLPHLGIVRMVLKAHEIAASSGKGLALYLVGDHYTPDMRPENLYVGLPLRGIDADHVKNPLTVPVGRTFRHVPFRRLPPPSATSLDEIERRSEAWLVNNAAHAGHKSSLAALKSNLRAQMDMLRDSARQTRSFGDWLMRVQVLWFDALLGGPSPHLVILPMSGIVDWLPEILEGIAREDERLVRIKTEVSTAQRMGGKTPYSGTDSVRSSFWVYCSRCERRSRATWANGMFRGSCVKCREPSTARWPEEASRVMPDIVAYETALFRAGIAGWVVGSPAPYHPVIERTYRELFGLEMPPKFFLTSVPRFWGLGEPEVGNPRARLLRVLLEIEPGVINESLAGPWDSEPRLRSAFL